MGFKRSLRIREQLNVGIVWLTDQWLKGHGIRNFKVSLTEKDGKAQCEVDFEESVEFNNIRFQDVFDKNIWPEFIFLKKVKGDVVFKC